MALNGSNSNPNTLVIVAGNYRAGTSAIYDLLGIAPHTSRLNNMPLKTMDQGMYAYMDVDIPAMDPSSFATNPLNHWTEADLGPGEAEHIFNSYLQHWNPNVDIYIEKSVPHLVKLRYLQAAMKQYFERVAVLIVVRHPVVCVHSSLRYWELVLDMRDKTEGDFFDNWARGYRLAFQDAAYLDDVVVLNHFDIIRQPMTVHAALESWVDTEFDWPHPNPHIYKEYAPHLGSEFYKRREAEITELGFDNESFLWHGSHGLMNLLHRDPTITWI